MRSTSVRGTEPTLTRPSAAAWPFASSSPAIAPAATGWRRRAYEIIFEHDTRAGRAFDVALLIAILLSMLAVMLETVPSLNAERPWLHRAEYVFTALFTVEYVVRLLCVREPRAYALSFFGLVDLVAVLPTYISLLLPGAQSLLVIRGLRLLRMFRVLKLAHMAGEGYALAESLRVSRGKIVVFLVTVSIVVTIMGAAMYLVEGRENRAFRSIPDGMYWAIVTMATVGYGADHGARQGHRGTDHPVRLQPDRRADGHRLGGTGQPRCGRRARERAPRRSVRANRRACIRLTRTAGHPPLLGLRAARACRRCALLRLLRTASRSPCVLNV